MSRPRISVLHSAATGRFSAVSSRCEQGRWSAAGPACQRSSLAECRKGSTEPGGGGAGFAPLVGAVVELLLQSFFAVLKVLHLGVAVVDDDHVLRKAG